ncbi:MAG: arylsulfatase [Spirochaetota bacterium]
MATTESPNILLIITDQHRGDALGVDGHPVLQTPYLDHIAGSGARFRHAYTACPVCIPARRTLLTGKTPASHGVTMNYNTWFDGPTLPGVLAEAGYQTHLCGKLHLWPHRAAYGFQSSDWADNPHGHHENDDDYQRFLRQHAADMPMPGVAHSANFNGWVARPWHLEERLHFSNWVTDKAMEFLDRRDPTRPFFLNVSYHQPHEPCTPPQVYWDRYINEDLPEPPVGEWALVFDEPNLGQPVTSWRTKLTRAQQRQYQAGYYGCINHIDDQIGRLLMAIPKDTVICFVSDHGEMLGDHQWIRKRTAYEGSARIPFLFQFPEEMQVDGGQVRDEPVELMDVMPTLLDAGGVEPPEGVDGRSLLPLLRGAPNTWRDHVHGECAIVPSMNSGMHYLTDGKTKYVWYPGTGHEELFDLENDPQEMVNLAAGTPGTARAAPRGELRRDPAALLEHWREAMVAELDGRPEDFVREGELAITGGNAPPCLPGYEVENFRGRVRSEAR